MKINSVILTCSCVTWELFELKGFQWGLQKLPIDFESFVTSPALTVERLVFWSQIPPSPSVVYSGSCRLWGILVSVFSSLECLSNAFSKLLKSCIFGVLADSVYSLFEGTWAKNGFNVQIFCLWHMPICSSVYVASLACILSIHWGRGDLFSSILQTWWVFLVFDKCQHFPHQTLPSYLREGTVKSPDYTITLWFGQIGTIGRGWGPSAKTNSIDSVVDLLGAVSGLRTWARVLVFK